MFLKRLSYWIAPVVIVWLFGSTLTGQDRLAFRDVSHFYTPLYDYVADRCSESWLPLWNPLDQTGIPLIGESTTAVFYPVRYVVFALPLNNAMSWYVVLHLILASWSATWLAGRGGVLGLSAVVAGICYPLCGSVLFLYSNPPFLVGAAWLPFALAALIAKRPMRLRVRCLIAGFALSMMVLGGDPQTGLHCVLVAATVWVCRLRRPDSDYPAKQALVAIVGSSLIAAALAAPQIAASMSWSRQSERVTSATDESWYSPPESGSVRSDAYQFSLPPWHAVELITPNAFGELFPINRRLAAQIPGESRMWTPTIYISMLALLALVASIGNWRRNRIDTWTAIAVVSLLLSLGHFGVAWMIQQVPGLLENVDSAIGGAYWWLYQFLPGYSSFRYPIKWLPVFSLAASIVTAQFLHRRIESIDEDNDTESESRLRFAVVLAAAGILIGYIGLVVMRSTIEGHADLADDYWGPLNASGGVSQMRWSLLHSAVVLLTIVALHGFAKHQKSLGIFCLLLVVSIDLGLGVDGLIAKADVTTDETVAVTATETQALIDDTFVFRTNQGSGWPSEWKISPSELRTSEVAAAERIAWFGRWHLDRRVAVLNNMTSIRAQQMALFWKTANEVASEMSADEQRTFWRGICRWLDVTDVLNVSSKSALHDSALRLPAVSLKSIREQQTTPLVTEWNQIDSNQFTASRMLLLLSEINPNSAQQPERRPIVENVDLAAAREPGFLHDQSQAFETNMQVESETLFVRRVFQDGNWIAVATNSQTQERKLLPVRKVDFLKQGVVLPVGSWNLQIFYSPRWLTPTVLIAIVAWICCLVSSLRIVLLGRRDRLSAPGPATAALSADHQGH